MNNDNITLSLSFVTQDTSFVEHTQTYPSVSDALEDADDVAFTHTGFPLESWESLDFGFGNSLFLFYPNDDDKTSRYKLTLISE
ncbi:hypothetical protein [Burkholderia pseudomallei]|uniref:hypothetical protein n=1 Tax=Burkholderia pseudomallei TaxID=28450 RepID=UPI00105F3353|nr:hypothetical protein [Burkholderia pseudomallei]